MERLETWDAKRLSLNAEAQLRTRGAHAEGKAATLRVPSRLSHSKTGGSAMHAHRWSSMPDA
jgi:hypothetical protein